MNETEIFKYGGTIKIIDEIIGFTVGIEEIGNIAFEISPDEYVQDTANDFIDKGTSNVTFSWQLSFQSNKK